MNTIFNVCYITDDNYILTTKTSINSILKNCSQQNIVIHVICVDVSVENMSALEALSTEKIKIITYSFENDYKDLEIDHPYISKAALFKFKLPDIFPDLDRLLYVDGDMIMNADFTNIFSFDISDKYAAVVQDMYCVKMEHWNEKLGLENYFNSGMMYLNLKKMRSDNIPDKLTERGADSIFMDQNALNAVLGNNVLYVSPYYNFLVVYQSYFSPVQIADFFGITEEEVQKCFDSAGITHFAGVKPWKQRNAQDIKKWTNFLLPEDSFTCILNYFEKIEEQIRQERVDVFESQLSMYVLGTNSILPYSYGVKKEGLYDMESWGCWSNSPCSFTFYGNQIFKARKHARLCIEARSFNESRNVKIFLNGFFISELNISTSDGIYEVNLPFEKITQSKNEIKFVAYDDLKSPKELGLSADERKLFIAFQKIYIENPLFEINESQVQLITKLQCENEELKKLILFTKNHTLWGFFARCWHKVGKTFRRK